MNVTKIIPLDSATEGMTLAENLSDSRGHILLPAMARLTNNMITSLRRHQIAQVVVIAEGEENLSDEADRTIFLEKKIQRINRLFAPHENHALNAQFKSYVIDFFSAGDHGKN